MKVGLQGDIHGDPSDAERAMQRCVEAGVTLLIILGDYAYGWPSKRNEDFQCGVTEEISLLAEHYGVEVWFIDGNHENFDQLEAVGAFGSDLPKEVAPHVTYIPRGTLMHLGDSDVLFIGGAYSVDKRGRTPHISWWPQEEITTADLFRALEHEHVDVVLSHDVCQTGFRAALRLALYPSEDKDPQALDHLVWKNDQAFPDAAPNRKALECVWEKYHPARWYHGHYHADYTAFEKGTEFNGLANNDEIGSFRIVEF